MNNDPYRPPVAAVADAPRPVRPPVPWPVRAALALLAIAVGFGVWSVVRRWGAMMSGDINPVTFLGEIVMLAIPWFFLLPLLRGRAWARTVVAVSVGLSFCVYLLYFGSMRSEMMPGSMFYVQDSTAIVIGTLPQVANVLALVMLFWPARAWFRRAD